MVKVIHKLNDLEIGDVVTLVSGSPDLTVIGFAAPEARPDFAPPSAAVVEDSPVVVVAWFTESGFGQTKLPVDALVVKKRDDAPTANKRTDLLDN